MSEKRRDNRNRILREGEYQRTDGRYRYRYIDEDGKEKNVYSWPSLCIGSEFMNSTNSGLKIFYSVL